MPFSSCDAIVLILIIQMIGRSTLIANFSDSKAHPSKPFFTLLVQPSLSSKLWLISFGISIDIVSIDQVFKEWDNSHVEKDVFTWFRENQERVKRRMFSSLNVPPFIVHFRKCIYIYVYTYMYTQY